MKKLGMLLAVLLGFTSITFATFSDIGDNETYKVAIEGLVEKNVIHGYEDNTFRPAEKISRAEFTKMIVTATMVNGEGSKSFTDVTPSYWAAKYISIAVANGYIKGYEDDTFRPEENITYGEVVTILLRAMGEEEEANKIELPWPQNYMKLAEELNLFRGYQTNDLLADNAARRDNVALMVWNMLQGKENIEASEIDTKLLRVGIVEEITERRGEKYITVKEEDKNTEYKLYRKSSEPVLSSFIVYQVTENKELKLKKQLLKESIADVAFVVEASEDRLVKLEGQEKLLDLELSTYVVEGEKIKLDRYTYYLVEMEDDEYVSVERVEKEKLNVKKEDKICFDTDVKISLVIREQS